MNRLLIFLATWLLDRVDVNKLTYKNSFKRFHDEIRETETEHWLKQYIEDYE